MVIKLAETNFNDFGLSIKLLQKLSMSDYFPKVNHVGFFIHEGLPENNQGSDSPMSNSSKMFSVCDRIKQYYVTPMYGPSLKKIISLGHKLTMGDIRLLGLSLLDALLHLHQNGIVFNNLNTNHVLVGCHNF